MEWVMETEIVIVGNYELAAVHPDMIRVTHRKTGDAVTVKADEFQLAMNLLVFKEQSK